MFTRAKPQPAYPENHPLHKEPEPAKEHNINEIPLTELKLFHEKVGEILAARTAQAREDFRQDVLAKLDLFGMSHEDFKRKSERKERKKREAVIKYRDPDNTDNTWTGRGRAPSWVQEKLDAGRSLEEFAVETSL